MKNRRVKVNGNIYVVSEYKAEAIQTAKDFYTGTKFLNTVLNMILNTENDNDASRALMTAHKRFLSLC